LGAVLRRGLRCLQTPIDIDADEHPGDSHARLKTEMWVYYHLYSCEKMPGLIALKHNLDLARKSPLIPITTSRYAGIADGFYSTRVVAVGPNAWRIDNRGLLGTIRFDRTGLNVDFSRSRGVLGQTRYQGSLYVALDEAEPSPVVALGTPAPGRLHLSESRWRVWKLREEGHVARMVVQGFGAGEFVWRGAKPGRYRISMGGKAMEAASDDSGLLKFTLAETAYEPRGLELALLGGGKR